MTRDMALSWRINKFINEVSHDCYVINSSVNMFIVTKVTRRDNIGEKKKKPTGTGYLCMCVRAPE
jgi:alpha-galactosidase/6-phospho-beta-glucosidase family protein